MSRKSTMPTMPTPTGSGAMSKVLGAVVFLAVLVLVVKHPAEAAEWAKGAFSLIEAVAEGVANFIRALS